ncbi:Uncharacterised protein [Achromobacter xylosoxidans]|nr:Uncharacterised protein [Achromobacter xylosoxidans]
MRTALRCTYEVARILAGERLRSRDRISAELSNTPSGDRRSCASTPANKSRMRSVRSENWRTDSVKPWSIASLKRIIS